MYIWWNWILHPGSSYHTFQQLGVNMSNQFGLIHVFYITQKNPDDP